MKKYDIAIIGAGPGGYVAAIRAAQLGARVAVIEKERVGGTCLNWGCIPSKALIACGRRYKAVVTASELGIQCASPSFNWPQIINRKNEIVDRLRNGILFLFKKQGVELIYGQARLKSPNEIAIQGAEEQVSRQLSAEKIIIATGAQPATIPSFNIDGENIMTSKEALDLGALPSSMIIVGGGVIGCEFSSLFAAFGVSVTLLEALPDILSLSGLDARITRQLHQAFKKQGIKVITDAMIQQLRVENGQVVAHLKDGKEAKAEKAVVSIGRRLNTEGLALEELGIQLDNQGAIAVSGKMETNVKGIYAIGDVTGKAQLAHLASRQGVLAVTNALGLPSMILNYEHIPGCIFTDPPIGFVGLSEKMAKERGMEPQVGQFFYRSLGIAHAVGEPEGLVKIIADQATDQLLGAHIIGAEATELIHTLAMALQHNMTSKQAVELVYAHPTYSESLGEALADVHHLSIHQ